MTVGIGIEERQLRTVCNGLRHRGFERTVQQVKAMIKRDAAFDENTYYAMLLELATNIEALENFIHTLDERPTMFIEREVPVYPIEMFAICMIVAVGIGFLFGMHF